MLASSSDCTSEISRFRSDNVVPFSVGLRRCPSAFPSAAGIHQFCANVVNQIHAPDQEQYTVPQDFERDHATATFVNPRKNLLSRPAGSREPIGEKRNKRLTIRGLRFSPRESSARPARLAKYSRRTFCRSRERVWRDTSIAIRSRSTNG